MMQSSPGDGSTESSSHFLFASSNLLRLWSRRYRWVIGGVAFTTIFLFLFYSYGHQQPLPPSRTTASRPVDWSEFAYTQYVTNGAYLCNSVMFFEALHRLSSRADRVLMYPSTMLESEQDTSDNARLILKARDDYNAKLVPVTVQHRTGADATWADSFTKLLAFNQTQYKRVLSIDSDSILLQHMDELFLLPPVPVAMPRAYWLYPDKEILSSQVILIEPTEKEFARVMEKVSAAGANDYDMEIVNELYRDSALVLPHRPYDMLTAEFRGSDHSKYLGSDREPWDPVMVYNEAKLAHFSDWPVPKPWLSTPEDLREKMQPDCTTNAAGEQDCIAREIWNGFYTDFKNKRKEVCG